jgi:hypothetical protein
MAQLMFCDDWLHGIDAFQVVWYQVEEKSFAVGQRR